MTQMICAQAKTTTRRDERIEALLGRYPELTPQSLGAKTIEIQGMRVPAMQYSYINWNMEDDQTLIELEMRDDTKVERLASELRACGCMVKVMTQEEYRKQEGWTDDEIAGAV
jgi:hypothetical protein